MIVEVIAPAPTVLDVLEPAANVLEVSYVRGLTGPQGEQGPQGDSYTPGDPIYVFVRNATGATLAKGDVVYTSGANGTHVQVTKALATNDTTSATTMGFVFENIANGADGYVVTSGYIKGIDTDGYTAGQPIYLSPTTPGTWTTTKPVAPNHIVYLGVITRINKNNGSIFVHPQNGYELDELHNVLITSPTNNQVLTYDASLSLWKNATNPVDGVSSVAVDGTYITNTGSSTAVSLNFVPSALTITQSQVTGLVSALAGKADAAATTTALAGKAALTATQTFTGTQTLTPSAIGNIPLISKGLSGQTANLQEWQDSTGAVVASMSISGSMTMPNGQLNPLAIRVNSIGLNSFGGPAVASQVVTVNSISATSKPLVVKGSASQSANLQEWQNSAGTVRARIDASGNVFAPVIAGINNLVFMRELENGGLFEAQKLTATVANPGNGKGRIYFRDGTNAGTLKLVVRAGAAGAETTILDNIPQ